MPRSSRAPAGGRRWAGVSSSSCRCSTPRTPRSSATSAPRPSSRSPWVRRSATASAFDTPEAEIRRTGTQSAAEKLIVDRGLDKDPRLALMARLGHVWEITPWAYATDTAVKDLSLRMFAAKGTCGDLAEVPTCAERVLRTLDAWYDEAGARR